LSFQYLPVACASLNLVCKRTYDECPVDIPVIHLVRFELIRLTAGWY